MIDLLGDDPRYGYYGRSVGLNSRETGDIDRIAALARAQGNTNCGAVSDGDVADVRSALEQRGLAVTHYAKWEGGDDSLSVARDIVGTRQLPEDLVLTRFNASTPAARVASLAEMSLGCGVLPICGESLRGLRQPAVCVAAVDAQGDVVCCAAASAIAHSDHPTLSGQAWWGMLATRPDRRGQRLALILGAHAMLEMRDRFGFRSFMTGVEPGNAPSEAVCAKMAMAPRGYAVITCADPAALASGRMTK